MSLSSRLVPALLIAGSAVVMYWGSQKFGLIFYTDPIGTLFYWVVNGLT